MSALVSRIKSKGFWPTRLEPFSHVQTIIILHCVLEISSWSEFATLQPEHLQRVVEVIELAVADHLHVLHAAGTHNLELAPLAVGQGVHQVFVSCGERVIAVLPNHDAFALAALDVGGGEVIVKAIDDEVQLLESQRVVGIVLHTQSQLVGCALGALGEIEIEGVFRVVGGYVARHDHAIAHLEEILKAYHSLGNTVIDPNQSLGLLGHVLNQRVVLAQQLGQQRILGDGVLLHRAMGNYHAAIMAVGAALARSGVCAVAIRVAK